jgi:hypothetical protein
MNKGVPIATHGDGLPCLGIGHIWQKSFEVFSWCSLTGLGLNTLLMNWLVWCFPKGMTLKTAFTGTRKKFYKILAWSLEAAWNATWPAADWDGNVYPPESLLGQLAGTHLAGGWFLVLWKLKGDLEFFAEGYGLNNSGSKDPCALCQCDNRDASRPWTDFSVMAKWIATIWKPAEWKAAHPDAFQLFFLPGMSILAVCMDYLHTKHIGMDQYFLGSVLVLLVDVILRKTPEENLQDMATHFKVFYKDYCLGRC